MWLYRMCLYVWESGLPHNYVNYTISIQTGMLLKAKRSNVSNYIKHKSRPSWQTETYVYIICNEPQTVPIPLQTVLNDPRPLLWKHILFASCWEAETSIYSYSRQADFLPGRKELSQHRQFSLRKRIVLHTRRVLAGLTGWDSKKSEASPQRMSVCPSGKTLQERVRAVPLPPSPTPGPSF